MKLFTSLCALFIAISLQAQNPKELSYDWIVNHYRVNKSLSNNAHIKEHHAFYTELVKEDLNAAQLKMSNPIGRLVKLVIGGYIAFNTFFMLIAAACLKQKDIEHLVVTNNMRADAPILNTVKMTLAVASVVPATLASLLIKSATKEYTTLKQRIALDEMLITELYSLSCVN